MLNGKWIANTNYKEQLLMVHVHEANQQFHTLNSIALLSRHIHYYVKGVLQVLRGGSLDIRDQYSFDFAPIETEAEWQHFQAAFLEDAEAFAQQIEQLPDEVLDTAFTDIKYGNYARNLDAMIEHAYYHLGQIVLIRKLIQSPDPS